MSLKCFIGVAVLSFAQVSGFSKAISRVKRSDDFIPCDMGWYSFRQKCFYTGGQKTTDRFSWEHASDRCKNFGGKLATIQSQEEQDFITVFMLFDIKFWTWIGLNNKQMQSEYVWDDGSVLNFTNWRKGEPNGPEAERCIEIVFDPEANQIGIWNDIFCHHVLGYICQKNANTRMKSPNPLYCSSDDGGGWKYQNSCYHVVTDLQSWENAEQHCVDNYNGHLVTILDKSVDYFLEYILSNNRKELWIGIKIRDRLQQKWTSGWHVSYNGINKELDFIEGMCVLRKARQVWTIAPCSKKRSFICETSTVIPPVLKPPVKGSFCPGLPHEWIDLEGEFCYYIETERSLSGYEAMFDCKRRGGELLKIHSKEETDILHPFVIYGKRRLHIGLLRLLADETIFVWGDGSRIAYNNWNKNEPNNVEEKCVQVTTINMKWDDIMCNEGRGFICSVRKITPNTTEVVEKMHCSDTRNTTSSTEFVEKVDYIGDVYLKALIGVSVCTVLLMILLGATVCYFRRRMSEELQKNSSAVRLPSLSQARLCPRYSNRLDVTVKDDEDNYETMN